MGLFDLFKKKSVESTFKIHAPILGEAVELEKINDKTFASKMMGDGIAIIPSNGEVHSPVDGKISSLIDSKHAYGLTSKDGLDILVHIGLDTVNLKGEGFECLVKQDEEVKQGQLIAKFNMDVIKSKGYELTTPVILIAGDYEIVKKMEPGKIESYDSVVFEAKKSK